jgi:hypothetical protein
MHLEHVVFISKNFLKQLIFLLFIINEDKSKSLFIIMHIACSLYSSISGELSFIYLFSYVFSLLGLIYIIYVNDNIKKNHYLLYSILLIVLFTVLTYCFTFFSLHFIKQVYFIFEKLFYTVKTGESSNSANTSNTGNFSHNSSKPPKRPNDNNGPLSSSNRKRGKKGDRKPKSLLEIRNEFIPEDDKEKTIQKMVRKSALKGIAREKVAKWQQNPVDSDGSSVYSTDSREDDSDHTLVRKYEVKGRKAFLKKNAKDNPNG